MESGCSTPEQPSTSVRSSNRPSPDHPKTPQLAGSFFFKDHGTLAFAAQSPGQGLQSGSRLAKLVALAHRFRVLVYLSAWLLAISPRIYGGQIAKPCEFPTTVYTMGCTGTLIHPKVVISAGHCPAIQHFDFGERASAPALRVKVKWCESTAFSQTDARICVLEQAIDGLPFAPIAQGCEVEALKAGASVLVAGFGLDEDDPASGAQPDEKRWVATSINQVSATEISVGGEGKGGCQGDSGGPVYLKLKDGTYRTVGVTHGGNAHPDCDKGIYKRSDQLLDWYRSQLRAHAEDDIDLRPCFDEAGKWAPSQACGGYTKDVKGPHGSWSEHCGQGMPSQRFSASCGAPFDPSQAQGSTTQASSGGPPLSNSTKDDTGTASSPTAPPPPMRSKASGSSNCQLGPSKQSSLSLILILLLFRLRRR